MPFDLKVHTIDSYGRIVTSNPYRIHFSADKGALYERDGIFYYENGEIAKQPKSSATIEKEEVVEQKAKVVKV